MSHHITQFSLVNSMNPNDEEASSVSAVIGRYAAQLFVACQMAIGCGVGKPLALKIIYCTEYVWMYILENVYFLRLSRRVIRDIKDLVEAVHNNDKSTFAFHTGKVWESSSVLKKLPKSNYIASKRKLLEVRQG